MRARRLWPLALALVFGSCTVEEVDFSEKTCPCDEGWSCDVARNRCVLGGSTDGGAGFAGASGKAGTGGGAGSAGVAGTGGTSGIGGASGSGGTGNCASTEKLCGGICVSNSDPYYGCTTTFCDPCAKPTNGSAVCSSGVCTLGSCDPGWDDCDNEPSNGCEFAATDDANCGACGRTCSLANALSSSCQNAQCAPVCNPGYLDCETPSPPNADDGCETDPNANDQHCGTCSNDCSSQGASDGFKCSSGVCGCTASSQCALVGSITASCDTASRRCVCGFTTCAPGEACNKVQGQSKCRCNGGGACTSGQTCCPNSGCANLTSDPFNCGVCGRQCANSQSCSGGACL